jgi:hypothetical protein
VANGGKVIVWADGDTRSLAPSAPEAVLSNATAGFVEVSGKRGFSISMGVSVRKAAP